MAEDPGIENLLLLDGEIIEADSELEYFVQFRVKQIEPTEGIPHGISYSLTLHDKGNVRLMGFDNAHPVKDERRGQYSRYRKLSKWDHKHKFKDVAVITPYEYTSAEQLMVDFWEAVDEAIKLDKPGG